MVSSLEEAQAALQNGAGLLQTVPHVLAAGGAGYVKAMWDELRAEYPKAILIADAEGDAALALAALREGLTHVRFTGGEPYRSQLQSIAMQTGAVIVGD